jgi:beta-galactosidase
MPANSHLEWETTYAPGRLEAIGYNGETEVCRETVHTAGEPARIELTCDRDSITADGCDVLCITTRILDSNGHEVPTADNPLEFSVEGAGRLIGIGNGDPRRLSSDKASFCPAFNGLCLAIVQSNGLPGQIGLTVSSAGISQSRITLQSR